LPLLTTESQSASLPITRTLTLVYVVSLIIALIITVSSVAGLLYRTSIYPAGEPLYSFAATDVINLVVGLPALLGSMWLARRAKLVGLLCWPGALLYSLYVHLSKAMAYRSAYCFCPTSSWSR
jgi:hypothetical protein